MGLLKRTTYVEIPDDQIAAIMGEKFDPESEYTGIMPVDEPTKLGHLVNTLMTSVGLARKEIK